MLSQSWKTSERKYRVIKERDFAVPVSDGTRLDSFLFRPDAEGKFPVILGVCAYSLEDQVAPVMPVGTGGIRGHMEAGDPNFYVARGYVHVIMNVRGTGKSEGLYDFLGAQETRDIYEAIEWLAERVTIYHDAERPSQLLVPVIRGNRIGTFISGGLVTN